MLNQIEKKLTEDNFVAILLNETSDVSNFAQLSSVSVMSEKIALLKNDL